jgi:adenine-specific DNA methylase
LRIGTDRVPTEAGDARPQVYGVDTFDQLFNERQLLVHGLLFAAIAKLAPRPRNVAALVASEALATNCMMNAYAATYGRASAAFSIHGYMYVARPVELNPWVFGSGRGTIWNCLRKAQSALAIPTNGDQPHRLHLGSLDALKKSSARFDIVCTDPPYYDNVAYERLAAFYETWLKRIPLSRGVVRTGGRPLPLRGPGFGAALGRVFARAGRLLDDGGVVIFTYAHTSDEGWRALEDALTTAHLAVVAVHPAETEGRNGFHRYKGSLKWNAVIVCRRVRGIRASLTATRRALTKVKMSSADKGNLRRAMLAANRVNRILATGARKKKSRSRTGR